MQDLNIWVRGRLPQGRIYNALRRVYRAVNTKPLESDGRANSDARDRKAHRMLAEHYAPMLIELERDFGLDLTRWKVPPYVTKKDAGTSEANAAADGLQLTPPTPRAFAP